ncbi:SufS family cysteine desulfurase [Fructilactobacillus vespulae]|uniref:SufS family cysteine desulfurase n=1 Tax=Fructilactobacillus vespulae TaxID=1249630 RepID=UPI0039B63128
MKGLTYNYKKDFPILTKKVNGETRSYLDNAATSQKPQSVINAITDFYQNDNANVHRGVGSMSQMATDKYESARQTVADFINAPASKNIVFTRSSTESLNWIATGYATQMLEPEDEIIVSIAEHHSNLIPWQQVAKQTGAKLSFVGLHANGTLNLAELEKMVSSKTKIIAINHISNVLGSINPIAEIANLAHQNGAIIVVDAAQSAPHLKIDVQKLDADFLVFSGHKMLGPTGIGVLYGKTELLEQMQPVQFGGEMIDDVQQQSATWAPVPLKFEAGTPNIAGAIGLAAAIDYINQIGINQINAREDALMKLALSSLNEIAGVTVYGPTDFNNHKGVLSFNLAGIHAHDVSTGLDLDNIEIRAGHHCAQPLMKFLDVESMVRASISFYNDETDINRLIESIKTVKEFFANELA